MKIYLAMAALLVSTVSMAQQPQQMVINVDRQDFKPIQEVSWKIMAGNSNISRTDGNVTRSGTGLGVGIEKMLTDRWAVAAHYANIRSVTAESSYWDKDENGNYLTHEYRENINAISAYGKFSFVNFPINKWNLVQVSLLGGVMAVDKTSASLEPVYGASASYNYDNLIGFELNTKVNVQAEASTSANLIGYF